ncbi:dynein axonemal assembly factor 3 [Leptosomus discolor]
MEEGLGTVCWWGLSPALDLRQYLPPDPDPEAEAAVLLVGAAEGRHLLLTAARARRGPPRAITLFVAEQRPEAVARQLLFLLLAAEAPGRTQPAARAAAILELLGSGRLRAATAALLSGAAARLRRWVTEDRYREGPADLGLMKVDAWGTGAGGAGGPRTDRYRWEPGEPGVEGPGAAQCRWQVRGSRCRRCTGSCRPQCRERDALEAVLRRWERPVPVPESRAWDRRLRRRLGARYDARAAVADWELRMGLHPRGVTGAPGGGAPGLPGAASPGVTGGGERRRHTDGTGGYGGYRGLYSRGTGSRGRTAGTGGTTVTGPFLAFGLDTDGLRSSGKTATEISLANVTALLHELHTGTPTPDDPLRRPGPPPPRGNPQTTETSLRDPPKDPDPPGDDTGPLGPLLPLPVQVRFLPLGSACRPPARARLGGSLQELTPELGGLAAPGATLLVELPTFAPTLRQPQLDAFLAQAAALARASGFEPWGGPGEPPACARFRRTPHP